MREDRELMVLVNRIGWIAAILTAQGRLTIILLRDGRRREAAREEALATALLRSPRPEARGSLLARRR